MHNMTVINTKSKCISIINWFLKYSCVYVPIYDDCDDCVNVGISMLEQRYAVPTGRDLRTEPALRVNKSTTLLYVCISHIDEFQIYQHTDIFEIYSYNLSTNYGFNSNIH